MKAYRLILCFMLALNSGCIHTTSSESKRIYNEGEKPSFTSVLRTPKIRIKNLIYSAEKYPLEDFFLQLARGQFKTAFKKARLSYKPSNSNNEILKSLLNSGLVPVLVTVKNISSVPVSFSYEEFSLAGNSGRFRSLNPERLPSHVRQFSPGAVAANVFNITVVAAVSLMILLLLVHSNGNTNIPDFPDEKILNPTEKTTHVDYQKYVIRENTLAPGQEVTGLIFFSLESMVDTEGFSLEYIEIK